jgi:ATP-dependent DNA helicase PIF1
MERLKVDMGKIFEAGQAYVALSRATSLEGLQVLNFDKRAVQSDERVEAFYNGLKTVQELMQETSELAAASGSRKAKVSRKKSTAASASASASAATSAASTTKKRSSRQAAAAAAVVVAPEDLT